MRVPLKGSIGFRGFGGFGPRSPGAITGKDGADDTKTTADDRNPGVPLKGSIRVPLRGSFKGSIVF